MPLRDIPMLSSEDASTQNKWENLTRNESRVIDGKVGTYLGDISSTNLRQICVFPIPPIPQRRHDCRLLVTSWINIFSSLSRIS